MNKPLLKLFTLCCIVLSLSNNSSAQSILNYAYATGNDASLSRSDGSLIDDIDMSFGTTILLFGSQANTQSTLQSIGFDFYINGTRQTNFNVTSNGWVGIGATALPSNTWLGTAGVRLAPFLGSTTTSMAPSAIGRVHFKVFGTAPSRICVIEFLRMSIVSSVLDDTSTFQVRLYENNGEVEYVYGRMAVTAGAPVSFNVGMQFNTTIFQSVNVATHAASTSISTLNTFNTNGYITSISSFTNGNRRYYKWIPNPPADPTNFTVSGVTKNSMTISWTDATNEIGYAIYRSTDGLTYSFLTTLTANSTTLTQTGLTPNTIYYWRLYPIRESIGTSQDASASTLMGGVISSVASGAWNSASTWDLGIVPTLSDSVEVAAGHTVTLSSGSQANVVEVSGTLIYPSTTAAQLTINGNLIVHPSGIFNAGVGSLTTHTLNIGNTNTTNVTGSLIVNGQFDMATTANVAVTFTGALDGSVSGTGSVCDFANITLNKGSTKVPMLDIVRPITMLAATTAVRLTINSGTFRLSSASVLTPFPGSTGVTLCNANGKLWMNHASAQLLTTSTSGGTFYQVLGEIQMDAGLLSLGTGAFQGFGSTNTIWRLNGGTVNIGGSFQLTAIASSSLIMNGGNLVIDPQGLASLTSGTTIFNIPSASSLDWSSGNITIVDPHSAAGGTAVLIAAGGIKTITGGKLIIGGASSALSGGGNTSGFGLNITMPIYNLELSNNITGSNTRMVRLLADLTVTNLLELKPSSYLFLGSGTVERTLTLQGDFINNGTLSGTQPLGTQILGITSFNGAAGVQTVSGAGTTSNCNLLVINNTGAGVQFTNTTAMAFWKATLFNGTLNPGSNLSIGLSGRDAILQIGGLDETFPAGSFTSPPTYVGIPSFTYGPTSSVCSMGAFNELNAGSATLASLTVNDAQGVTANRNLTVTSLILKGGNLAMGSNSLTIGTGVTNEGVISRTSGFISTTGLFTRWYATGSTPIGSDSTGFPILNGINERGVMISTTGPLTTGGSITVKHNSVSGNTDLVPGFTDDGVNVDIRTNSNWIFTTSGLDIGLNTLKVKLVAKGLGAVLTTADLRFVRKDNGTNGTSVNGSGTNIIPEISRNFSQSQLSAGQLNDTFYVGTNAAINPLSPIIFAVASGSWGDSATWLDNDMPNASNSVFIPSGFTINVPTGTPYACNDLTVSEGAVLNVNNNTINVGGSLFLNGTTNIGGGTLAVSGVSAGGITIAATTGALNIAAGTLTLGAAGGSNRNLNNMGVLNVSGGTLNINGSMLIAAGSQFVQSGGSINIDGNSGTASTSLPSGTHLLSINTNNLNCNAGTITIVDPPHSSYAANSTMSIRIAASASLSCFTGSHLIRLGDGLSNEIGNTNGFVIDNRRTGVVPLRHIEVNGGSASGRWTSPSFNSGSFGLFFTGNLTITTGSELRHNVSSQLAIGGNIVNNGIMTSAWPLTLGGIGYNVTNNQDISGSGVFRNNISSSTGAFTSVTLNNGVGVTLNTTGQSYIFTGTLALAANNITTNSNTITIASTGALTRTTGYIIGNLGIAYPTGTSVSRTFHLGTATNYLPVTITFPTVSTGGLFTAQLNTGDVGAIATSCFNSNKTINKNWRLTSSVLPSLYNASVNYLESDSDGGLTYSNVRGQVYTGSAWNGNYAATATSTTATLNGLTAAGDLQLGEFIPVPLSVSITSLDTTNCAGNPGVFTATVINGGATPVYQWKKNGLDVGTNSNTYSTSSLSGGDVITCEVSSSIQCAVPLLAVSNAITIKFQTVKGSLSAAGPPICAGTSGPTLTLSGQTGSVIRWEKADAPYTNWTTIVNTATTQATGVLTVSTAFRAVVQNSSCSVLKTDSVIVTITPLVVKGAVTGGATVCSGSNSGLLTLSGQTGSVIRWERANSPFTSWTTITNTSTTYTSGSLTQNTAFRAVVQSGSCGTEASDSSIVMITPLVVKGAVTGGTTICAGSVSGTLTLNGQTGSVIRWERANAPYTSWTTIAHTATSYVSGALTQNTAFRAVVQSGACGVANSDSTIVTVTPLVVKGAVTGGTTICAGSVSGLLTLGGQTGAVVRWERANAPYTSWTTITHTGTTYTSGPLSQHTAFRAVVQSGACGIANSDSTIVTVTPLVVKGAVSGGSTICNGAVSGLLTLSGQTGTVIGWQKAVSPFTSWTSIANTNTTYTSGSLTQTTAFRAIVQSGACGVANSDSTIVTVTPVAVGGSVTGGTPICLGATSGTLSLAGNVGNVIRWERAVEPYTSWTAIAHTNTTYVSGALMQNTAFRAVVQTGSCETANSDSTIVSMIQLVVNGSMLGGSNICAGSTSGTLSLVGQTGAIVRWESANAPFTSWSTIAHTSTSYVSAPLNQTTAFRAVVQIGSCGVANSDSTIVNVTPNVVKGAVTGGTTICAGSTSGTLTLSGQTGSLLRWEIATAPFTSWTAISNTNTTYTSSPLAQTTAFRAVVQSGSCGIANSDSTVVTVTPLVVKGLVSGGSTICAGSTSGILSLSGQTGAVVRWESSVAPFTSWTSISNTNTTYTSGILTQTTAFRAVVQSGACGIANSDSAIVTVTPLVVKGAVTGGSGICAGSTSANLVLGGQTGAVIRWERAVAPYTTWTSITNTNTTYTSTALNQTTAFRAVVQSGACGVANSDSTIVTVTPVVVKGLVSGGNTICFGSTSALLTLSGETGNVVRWESAVSPFSSWVAIANTNTSYTSGSLTQTTAFRAVVQSGACGVANSDSTIVIVTPLVNGGMVSGGAAICSGSTSGILNVTGYNGTVIRWESAVAPYTNWTNISNTNPTYISGPLTQSTAFRAVVQLGACGTAKSDSTIVSVIPIALGGSVSGGTTVCLGSTSALLSLSGNTGSVVRWESAVAPFNSWSSITHTNTTFTSGALSQTTAFRAVVQQGTGCAEINSTPTTVTVNTPAVNGAITGTSNICTGSTSVLTLANQVGTIIRWESATAPYTSWTNIANTTAGYTSPLLTTSTAYRAVIGSGVCPSVNSDSFVVVVAPLSVGGTITGASPICSGSSSGSLTLTGKTGKVIRWESAISPFTTWTVIADTNTQYASGPLTQTTAFRAVVQSGSCSSVESDTTMVGVTSGTVGGTITGSASICSGTTAATLNITGLAGNVDRWESSVAPFTSWTTISNTTSVYAPGILTQTTQFRAIVSSGSCASASLSPVTIAVSPITVKGAVTGGTSICSGSPSATLQLAGQTGLVLRWESAVAPFTSWTTIANTNATYLAPLLTQTTAFRAVVQSGVCSVANADSTIVSVSPVTVPGSLSGASPICAGTAASLTLSGQTGSVERWESSVAPFTSWTTITNTNSLFNSASLSQTTAFRAVVKSGSCNVATTDSLVITVTPLVVKGAVSGGSTVCSGATSGALTLNGYTGSVVRWESATAPFTSWTTIANTTASYTSGPLSENTAFRVVVQSGNCGITNTDSTLVSVTPLVVKGAVTGGSSICAGLTSGMLTLNGHTGSVVRWESAPKPYTTWTAITNTNTTYTSSALSQSTAFRAVVQSSGCGTANSDSAVVDVTPLVVKGAVSGGAGICSGSTSGTLVLNGQTGTVVRWESAQAPFTNWTTIANTTTSFISGPLSQATAFRAVVQSGSCGISNSDSAIVTVTPLVVKGAVSGGTTICAGLPSGTLTLSGHTGDVIRWESASAPFTTWTQITNTNTTYISGNLPQTTAFRAVVQSGSCGTANSDSTIVAVTPLVVKGAVSGSTPVCLNTTSSLTLSGHTGNVIRWESSVAPFTAWTTITNTTTSLTSGSISQNTAFRAVVQSGACGTVNTDSFIVNTIANGVWLGSISNAWNVAGNWCGGVPVSTSDVVINAGAPNNPQINTAAVVNSLNLGLGATLTFSGTNNSIEILGSITEAGTFTKTNGKVIFGGAADQTIPAGVYGKLVISGGALKTPSGNTTILDSLTFQNGKIVLGSNNLTISNAAVISGASSNAFIVTNATGKLTQSNIGVGGRSGSILFPVGSAVSSYSPVTINNTGTADNFSVRVMAGAYVSYSGEIPTGSALTGGVVNKTWVIAESVPGGSNANISFEWSGADELSLTRSNMTVARYGTTWTSLMGFGAAGGSNPYNMPALNVTTFGLFGLGDHTSPLPVTLVSFKAVRTRNDVLLTWETAQEINNSHFEIERSYTGKNYEMVGKIAGNGTTNAMHTYQFEDVAAMLLQTEAFYRLKQVDFDGNYSYSTAVRVSNSTKATVQKIQAQPNPFNETVSITFTSTSDLPVTIELVDGFGRIVSSREMDATVGELKAEFYEPELKAGMYTVRLIQQNEEVKTVKVLKQ